MAGYINGKDASCISTTRAALRPSTTECCSSAAGQYQRRVAWDVASRLLTESALYTRDTFEKVLAATVARMASLGEPVEVLELLPEAHYG